MGTHPTRKHHSILGCFCLCDGKPGVKFNYSSKPSVCQRAASPPKLGFTKLISKGFPLEAELHEISASRESWNPLSWGSF